MIQGIFFARFLPEQGTKVVHQSPPGCIVPIPSVNKPRLIDFDLLSEYIIPRQAFCNRYITHVDPDNKYQILGHPVCIKDEKYSRNEFMFNFCLVVSVEDDEIPYEAVVRRLASTFTEMEIQNQFLSRDGEEDGEGFDPDRKSIAALLEIIKEDLNNYNECMIPVDDANTINMKLFPIHPNPPPIKSWHVPITKIRFDTIIDDTWDLTMKRVIAHVDGIKDVRRIAYDAQVSITLTKLALRHLLYYDSILILDLFLFSNIYAPTPDITTLLDPNSTLIQECLSYCLLPSLHTNTPPHSSTPSPSPHSNSTHTTSSSPPSHPSTPSPSITPYTLLRLFTTLLPSRPLREWLHLHLSLTPPLPILNHIDVRRLIQFGLIKGLIYRVHKYALSANIMGALVQGDRRSWKKWRRGDGMGKFADGCHCFDQVTVERDLGDQGIMEVLKKFPKGDVEIVYR